MGSTRLDVTRMSTIGLACWHDGPTVMSGYHRHNDVELNFVEHGAITYRFGTASTTIRSGQLGVFWAAMPHQLVHVELQTSVYWLTIPLVLFQRWQLPFG